LDWSRPIACSRRSEWRARNGDLNPILAEVALAGRDEGFDFVIRAPLTHGDKLHVGRIAPRELGCSHNVIEDVLASFCTGHRRGYRK
jgi:hypothetical protein